MVQENPLEASSPVKLTRPPESVLVLSFKVQMINLGEEFTNTT